MKKIRVFILLVALYSGVYAQTYKLFKDTYTGVSSISSVEDIKTKNDFDQKNMSSTEIDQKIASLMVGSLISDYEFPINKGKLKYHKKHNPKEYIEFYIPFYEKDMPMINKELEIYNYDGVWILVSDNSPRNLQNVFYAARAIQIIKTKYPEAYSYLLDPDQVELGYKKIATNTPGPLPILNKLYPIISFDKSPLKIAGSLYNKSLSSTQTRFYNNMYWYENKVNGLTSINYETDRPKEIYKKSEKEMNYWLYLKEGLIESLLHEFTHLYLYNFADFDKKAKHIFEKRPDPVDTNYNVDVEEAIVINTIDSYLMGKGGLSADLLTFNIDVKYQGKKKILSDLSIPLNKTRFDELKGLSPSSSSSFDDIYKLDFLKGLNLVYLSQYLQQQAQQREQEQQQQEQMKDQNYRRMIEQQRQQQLQQQFQQNPQQYGQQMQQQGYQIQTSMQQQQIQQVIEN